MYICTVPTYVRMHLHIQRGSALTVQHPAWGMEDIHTHSRYIQYVCTYVHIYVIVYVLYIIESRMYVPRPDTCCLYIAHCSTCGGGIHTYVHTYVCVHIQQYELRSVACHTLAVLEMDSLIHTCTQQAHTHIDVRMYIECMYINTMHL